MTTQLKFKIEPWYGAWTDSNTTAVEMYSVLDENNHQWYFGTREECETYIKLQS